MEQDALVPLEADEALVDGVSDWTEQRKFEVLDQLLDKTGRFSQFMAQKIVSAPVAMQTPPPAAAASARSRSATKRKSTPSSDTASASSSAAHECVDELQSLLPESLSLRAHQRVGVQWLISLYEQGLNGILADDMGLGKTLQLLTLLLHLRREGVAGPFLVVAPLSTLAHWDAEAKRVGLSSLIYHGDQTTRVTLRQRFMYGAASSPSVPVAASKAQSKSKSKAQTASKAATGNSDESDSSEPPALIITSYEVAMNDRRYLANVRGGAWRMLVVDEAHRLKNAACRLLRALHALPSEQRLLLTGTPLQNGLGELWSLLHFLMPVVFDDVDRFRAWFARMDDAGALESDHGRQLLLDEQRRHRIVTKLHDVLRPFLLRRTKLEVFGSGRQSQLPSSSSLSPPSPSSLSTTTLPPKREITLSTPLTAFQRKLYAFILDRAMAASSANSSASDSSSSSSRQSAPTINIVFGGKTAISLQNVLMQLRLICCHPYLLVDHADESHAADIAAARAAWLSSSAASLVPSTSVVPSSSCPYTSFRAQEDADYLTGMIAVSAKLQMLHRLLRALRSDGHKILIFSQFTRSLDIIQEYLELQSIDFCRLDGSTCLADRQASVARFSSTAAATGTASRANSSASSSSASPSVFLLSTRAGGLGLNLVTADTCILFDSDFNPQVDLQAADRCHRIGQSRPVSVYRLVAPRTVEAAVVARAHTKRLIATLAIDRAGLNGSVLTAAAEEQQSASAAASSPSSDAKSADDSMVVPCESFGLNELSDLLYGGVSASPTSPSPSPGAVRSSKRAKSASNSGAASAKGGDAAAASSPSAASLLSSSYADHRASNAANAPDSTSLSATAAAVLAPVCISDDHLARLVRDFRFDVGAATATNGSMPAAASLDVGFEVSQFWFGQD